MTKKTISWRTITSDRPQRRAERERAHVAHEDFRGVGVEPEETEPGARKRAAFEITTARYPPGK